MIFLFIITKAGHLQIHLIKDFSDATGEDDLCVELLMSLGRSSALNVSLYDSAVPEVQTLVPMLR